MEKLQDILCINMRVLADEGMQLFLSYTVSTFILHSERVDVYRTKYLASH